MPVLLSAFFLRGKCVDTLEGMVNVLCIEWLYHLFLCSFPTRLLEFGKGVVSLRTVLSDILSSQLFISSCTSCGEDVRFFA